ncbi:MAG: 5-formyltetrahydrofolate cyclo-ligase [Pseudomonadota bacterium]
MGTNQTTTPPDSERAELRARLLAARAALADRDVRERALAARVGRWLRTMPVTRLGFYWPVRGEPDLTPVIREWLAQDAGRVAALPVVAGEVLEFAAWTPRTPLQPGAYGIPVPATIERVAPQLLLIPCVGIDDRRYRLGYGGGFYDRTAAAFAVRPVLVGVCFDCGRIASIDPRPHDVRLDLAITESEVL